MRIIYLKLCVNVYNDADWQLLTCIFADSRKGIHFVITSIYFHNCVKVQNITQKEAVIFYPLDVFYFWHVFLLVCLKISSMLETFIL